MKLLLKTLISFRSELSQAQVIERLKTVMAKDVRRVHLEGRHSLVPYRGKMNDNRFHMVKNTGGERSAFFPKISGHVYEKKGETRIDIELKVKRSIWVGLVCWCGILGFGVVKIGATMVQNNGFTPSVLILIGLMLSAYVVAVVGFQIEGVNRTRQDLEEILAGRLAD